MVPASDAAPGDGRSGAGDDAARLRSLLEIARVIGSTRRFDDLVERSAESTRRALDAAALSISRWDRESGLLRVLVNVGLLGPGEQRIPEDETYSLADLPAMTALVEERLSFVSAVDDGTPEARQLAVRDKDSALSVPVIVEGRVWGEIWAARAPGQPRYEKPDLAFAEALATQIAAGVVQADHVARVERLAFTDPLTGLANRRAVDERLDDALTRHLADGTVVSIVLADINRLKQVNDTFGHEAGDRLIVAVAEAVSRASGLAQNGLAARIGGDEFCIVVVGEPLSVASHVADELCRLVEGQPMSTGVSCGVASTEVLPSPVDSQVRLFRLADAAQYRAKRAGAHQPVVAGRSVPDDPDHSPADRRVRRGRLSTDVQAALESALAVLDGMPTAGSRERLEAVADHVRDLLDAAGWFLSHAVDRSDDLVTVSSSVQRVAEPRDGGGLALVGEVFDLGTYPVTRSAIERAGSFFVEAGMPGNDPAEEAALVTAGYLAVVGAGARDPSGGWLVEIYADTISLPMGTFEPVLRALVAVAVAGAADAPRADAPQA
ncbi:MAG TPA: sensor domain-containing diguanylate cyclase [Actinomycetes bacterium]|nr:sensor domain-containing diguanylate cyclase [Actinomycetes bacterium]